MSCCDKQTPEGPAAFKTDMYECACSDPCYSVCKTFCDTNAGATPVCLACIHDNLDASQFCRTDAAKCGNDQSCKPYVDCVLNRCADKSGPG